ncbi:hypothetical protein Tco_0129423 [Tanacetum coccineum]
MKNLMSPDVKFVAIERIYDAIIKNLNLNFIILDALKLRRKEGRKWGRKKLGSEEEWLGRIESLMSEINDTTFDAKAKYTPTAGDSLHDPS